MTRTGTVSARRVAVARIILMVVALVFGCVGCGKSSASGPSGSSDLLIALNARFNDGRTVRWAALPIPVFLNGIARADEVNAWAAATGGAVTFTFVGNPPAAGIAFRFGGGNDVCGSALVEYESDGRITSADIQVVQAIFRDLSVSGRWCTRLGTPSGSWPIRRMVDSWTRMVVTARSPRGTSRSSVTSTRWRPARSWVSASERGLRSRGPAGAR